MRLWCDVYDAAGTRLNDGQIWLRDAQIRTVLDGVGTFSLSVPLTYDRAREWLTVTRQVSVYREIPGAAPHHIFDGVISSVSKRHGSGGWALDVSGDELLIELSYETTLLNRRYEAAAFATVVDSLTALKSWTATYEDTSPIVDARFDGAKVLKALGTVIERAGLHYRRGAGRILETGAFGADSGLILMNPAQPGITNPVIGFIESLTVLEESEGITNHVIGLGAGEGAAALTLKDSTRTFVDSETGPDGRLVYNVSDAASIATYGKRSTTWVYKDIAPISNSVIGKRNASNQLADAIYADLQKSKQSQITYSITARKIEVDVQVGDLLRVIYTGPIRRADGRYLAGDSIDAYFFITRLVEKSNDQGTTFDFEISNVDRPRRDSASMTASVLDEATAKNYKPQPSVYRFQDTTMDTTVNATNPNIPIKWAKYQLDIDDTVTDITSVKLRIRTKPLYSWSRFLWTSTVISANYNYFTVQHDTRHPVSLLLKIDGVDVTTDFGGPWNPTNDVALPVDVELDITDLIANSLYAVHTIEVLTGQATSFAVGFPGETANPTLSNYAHGLVEFTVKVLGVAQSILPT